MASISTDLVQTSGVWGGVIGNIPAGNSREFLARAFDASGTLLFSGSASNVTITANQTTLVAMTLQEANPPPPFSNEAPIIQSVSASSIVIPTGGSISLQATAQDPNGDPLTYAWASSAGSFSNATSSSTTWTAPNTIGAVTLTITVSDSQGAASLVSLSVNVVNSSSGDGSAILDVHFNSTPVVSALTASATELDVGQSTNVTVTATDGDGDSLSYQWESTCAGSWTNSTSRTASFSPSAIPSGACNNCGLTVTVSDGRGGQTTGTVALCVASATVNRFPPTIIRSYQSSLTASPSQQVTFEVTASDPQNSSLTFSWSANTGTTGTPQSSAGTSRVVWTAPPCVSGGTVPSITATVTNAYGLMATRTFAIAALPNCPGWSPTGAMLSPRILHSTTVLNNGKVLIAGGTDYAANRDVATAALYDPATGLWSYTGSMASARRVHTATLLNNGKVLVAGGFSDGPDSTTSELYDPVTSTWSITGSMSTPRSGHTMTLLPNGKVLVTGGQNNAVDLKTAEVYDPGTGTWASTGSMAFGREAHTATLLNNGKVLVTGGSNGANSSLAAAELYDPASGIWSATGPMAYDRFSPTATLLSSGKVLVTGGFSNHLWTHTAEVYDPASGTWNGTGSIPSTYAQYTTTLLPDGKVLIVGGSGSVPATADLYDPASGTWAATYSMGSARNNHTATLLHNGKVLVFGGSSGFAYGGDNFLLSAELLDLGITP